MPPKPINNTPSLWKSKLPKLDKAAHKYSRGHVMVVGGEMECTGAARLAAYAALRSGAGLVSVLCSYKSLPIYATSMMSVMTKPFKKQREFIALIRDERVTVVAIGPGNGVHKKTKQRVLDALGLGKNVVLDADALTVFADAPEVLFQAIKQSDGAVVLTPHEGEFAKLFGEVAAKERVDKARVAAKRSRAIVVLKGFETVIAAPNGDIVVNTNASAYLATAGSGDVLTGIVAGLIGQGMPAFDAACAAVWMHGEAAKQYGPGLISEDLLKPVYYR